MKKIILIGLPILAVVLCLGYFFFIFEVGGGASIQTAPDIVKAGDPVVIKLEVSVPGSKQNINGRYADIFLYYQTTGQDTIGQLKPKLISQTKDKEIYEFIIPPYPAGTRGEITYMIELKLDGHTNSTEGYKKIKLTD